MRDSTPGTFSYKGAAPAMPPSTSGIELCSIVRLLSLSAATAPLATFTVGLSESRLSNVCPACLCSSLPLPYFIAGLILQSG